MKDIMEYNKENYKNAKSSDTFDFFCQHCGKHFLRTKREISKNSGAIPLFCSKECHQNSRKEGGRIIVRCKTCGKEKEITLGEYNKNKNKNFFCNNSCSAIYNNNLRSEKSSIKWEHKNKGYNTCPECGGRKFYTSELCQKCSNKKKRLVGEKTLGYYIDGEKYLTTKCNDIRRDARKAIEEFNIEKVCAYCKNHEFDEILEVHHIKGILEHDSTTLIKEINSIDNLVWLCPNHHKMLEKGLITLDKIYKK